MNIPIIYGADEPPKISMKQSPKGEVSLECLNERTISLDPIPRTLSWKDALPRSYDKRFLEGDDDIRTKEFIKFTSEFECLTASPSEKWFFTEYVKFCLESSWDEDSCREFPWRTPALIPQVWVNWIPYDSRDKQRAERAQKEPFRVDFMLKCESISRDFIIIEIDGFSHIRDYDPIGNPVLPKSMDSFTRHTKQDRWLRKQGWQVYRITSQEVDECAHFDVLLFDVLGRAIAWSDPPPIF